jgi:tRNA G18 (ribose-2'-O)-methylase SpoU
MIVSISDPDDPRISAYRDVRERDLVGRQGRFMAEGEVVLRLLASHLDAHGRTAQGHRLLSLLVSEGQADRLADIIGALPPQLSVHVAGQQVMDRIVGFPIHRGILALGEARLAVEAGALLDRLGPRALVVAVAGITNHDNMGGIFRNAAAFGADLVLLDHASCDPLYRKAIRVSVGASLIVPFARLADVSAMMAALEAAQTSVVALSPSGRETLSSFTPPPRVAALFGTEGPGLPAHVLATARTLAIPMAPGFDSLNVATTSGIVLHHLAGV